MIATSGKFPGLHENFSGVLNTVGSHLSVIRIITYPNAQNNDIHRYFAVH